MSQSIILSIALPWPSPVLNPNSRCHWARRSVAVTKARGDAKMLTLQALHGEVFSCCGGVYLEIFFYPPDKRRRDDDNMIAAFKSARDGIADALKINDRNFVCSYRFEEPVKRGKIVVEVST